MRSTAGTEGMMDDEFLQLTDKMIGDHQTSLKAGEYKDELVTPATSLYSHPKTGQVVKTNEMVVPDKCGRHEVAAQ